MSQEASSAAPLRQIEVLTADGLRWTAQARSVSSFEESLRTFRTISVSPAGGCSSNGWRIATAHVVAWRLDDDTE